MAHSATAHSRTACALPDRPDRCPVASPAAVALAETVYALAIEAFEHHRDGRVAEAISKYQRVLALKPDLPIIHNSLGHAFADDGKFDAAIASYQRAIEIKPNYTEAVFNGGVALANLDRLEEAEAKFRHAIALEPRFAGAYYNLSVILKERGRLDEAKRAAKRAIRLAPRNVSYYWQLAMIRRFAAGDRYVTALENLALEEKALGDIALGELTAGVQETPARAPSSRETPRLETNKADTAPLTADDRIHLHFSLARAYEDTGRTESAFAQLLAGNRLKREHTGYNEAAALGRMERSRTLFTADFIASRQGSGAPSRLPVFIIGMPRSGTSLIEQILASHPEVFGAGELKLFDRAAKAIGAALPGAPEFPDMASSLSGERFRALGETYLGQLARRAPDASRIVDKMPVNFQYAGLIHLALPNATIIHAVRDPIDTCLSCFSLLFVDQPHSYDLAELGRYYRHYQDLMAHWRRVLPQGRIIDVRYEDLVGDLEGEARRIVAQCGLAWDARCVDFHRTDRAVRTASAAQVRQPIYRTSVGRWRKYETFLGPLLDELHYAQCTHRHPSLNLEGDQT